MNRIKQLRTKLDLTVRDLSEKAGIAIGYVSMLENDCDNKVNPTKSVMERIAQALNTTVTEVFY